MPAREPSPRWSFVVAVVALALAAPMTACAGNSCPRSSNAVTGARDVARSVAAAQLSGEALAADRMLIAHDETMEERSALATTAMFELGVRYQSIAQFEDAAQWFERFATLERSSPDGVTALTEATGLRLALRQYVQASKNVATFARNWGATRPAESARLALSVAEHLAESGDKENARATLLGAIENVDRGPSDLSVRAHALLARTSTPAGAKEEYAKVLSSWEARPSAARASLATPVEAESQRSDHLARELDAVGEAMFAMAEERRVADVASLKAPPYAGPASRAAVLAHVNGALKVWFETKKSAIEGVEREYRKVLDLEPVAPPRWVVAAASAVGLMWGELADELRRPPVAGSLRRDGALREGYYQAIDVVLDPFKARTVKPAIRSCVEVAAKQQYQDDRSRACAKWLATHAWAEHYGIDEILPGLVSGTLASDMPALSHAGFPHEP